MDDLNKYKELEIPNESNPVLIGVKQLLKCIPIISETISMWGEIALEERLIKIEEQIGSLENVVAVIKELSKNDTSLTSQEVFRTKLVDLNIAIIKRACKDGAANGSKKDDWLDIDSIIQIGQECDRGMDHIKAVIKLMKDCGEITVTENMNHESGLFGIKFTPVFFDKYDFFYGKYNSKEDALHLIKKYYSMKSVRVNAIAAELDWPERRLNSALCHLHVNGLIKEDKMSSGKSKYLVTTIWFEDGVDLYE